MTNTLVLDASALVAMLADAGPTGDWVATRARHSHLAAPALAVVETANVLRRQQLAGRLERTEATLAHHDLLAMPVQLWPYLAIADRAWELRDTLTTYHASYVALAEMLDAPLLTLDKRLARTGGSTCTFLTPPED